MRFAKSAARKAKAQGPGPLTAHLLHVELRHVLPSVWRDLLVPSNMALDVLHGFLRAAFPWPGHHDFDFIVEGVRSAPHRIGIGARASRVTVAQALPRVDAVMAYLYDFPRWVHRVRAKEIRPVKGNGPPAVRCLGGERACPPEDCGGPEGYAFVLDALRFVNHHRHVPVTLWLEARRAHAARIYGDARFEGPFDPAAFDLATTNRALAAAAGREA